VEGGDSCGISERRYEERRLRAQAQRCEQEVAGPHGKRPPETEIRLLIKGDDRMIRDRGRIKWTAMMLPEHVEQLREWQKEDELQVRQQPDEQQYEQWNYQIHEAKEKNLHITIHYWIDEKVAEGKGHIQKINTLDGTLHLVSDSGETHRIPFVHLKSISESE